MEQSLNIIIKFARGVNSETKKRSEYEEDYVLRNGRPRDSIHGGVHTWAWCQGCGLREKVLCERGGSPADKRCTDPPRGAGRSRYTRGHDNRPGPTVRSSQPDSSQGWDSKVALWISSYRAYEFTRYVVFLPPFRSKRTSISNNFALTYYTYPPFVGVH